MRQRLSELISKVYSLLFIVSPIVAQAQVAMGDTLVLLSGATVTASKYKAMVKTDSKGATVIDMDYLLRMPKILGNADPLRLLQSMPGVHSNTEYDSGMYIDGCETSQTAIQLSGVPVYGATHLLGLFSVFNPSHFEGMRLQRNTFQASSASRIGAEVDMILPTIISKHPSDSIEGLNVNGEGSVGLMSSQATLRVPLSDKLSAIASARRSYLNLLYGSVLKFEDQSIAYGFGDYNATISYAPTNHDLLRLNFYHGNDLMDYADYGYLANMGLKWSNTLASAEWHRKKDTYQMSTTAYVTDYRSLLEIDEEALVGSLKASISELGLKSGIQMKSFAYGFTLSKYFVSPQYPTVADKPQHEKCDSKPMAASLFAENGTRLSADALITLGCKVHYFQTQDKDYCTLDPSAAFVIANKRFGRMEMSFGMKSQYLYQTGFSSRGLPTEFWITSNDTHLPPQRAYGIDASYSKEIFNKNYKIELNAYYKHLDDQVEYRGDILSMRSTYRLDDCLLHGDGNNMGVSLMLHKQTKRLTGWMSYTWQRTRRHFLQEPYNGTYPSNHDCPHTVNAVATYRLNKKWDFGAYFVYASGTPFTAPKEMFLINGDFVTQYGKHNGNRLPAYARLDVSVNYDIPTRSKHKRGVNFSLYNATARENAIFYRIRKRKSDGYLGYRPLKFNFGILPSISYYFKF